MLRLLTSRTLGLALLAALVISCSAPQQGVGAQGTSAAKNRENSRRAITILHVADLHAQLQTHPELYWEGGQDRLELAGGFARLATAARTIRQERPGSVLFLDGGDTLQGSGAAALTEGAAVLGPLAGLGIDAAVPGNWEVVYGAEVLRRRAKEIQHPLLAANIRDATTGELVFSPSFVREVGGVRVGVIGYTDPDVPRRQPPAYSKGLTYDGPEALGTLARQLRSEAGAEVVILLSHVGLSKAIALTREVSGIDVHLSGDTHERTYKPIDVDGTWVVEPGAFGSFLGRLDLVVENGRLTERRWELIEVTASRFEEAADVRQAVDDALAGLSPELDEVVGSTAGTLARYDVVETTVDNLLSDALRETTGTEIAISNGFRFASPIVPGPIRQRDLWNLFPVVTNLKTGKVTGKQLRDFWERELENVFATDATQRFGGWLPRPSGMTVRFVAAAPPGHRVREIRVGGELVDDTRSYTITACEREGDAADNLCRITNVREAKVVAIDVHEAVRRYLREHGTAKPAREGRVVGLDLPRVLRSQALPGTGQ